LLYDQKNMLNELIELQKLLWKDDDLMCQETLFSVQAKLQELVLKVAIDIKEENTILTEFPWLYREEQAPPTILN
jgi:hypothetical protein